MNIDHFIPLDYMQAYNSMEQKFERLGQLKGHFQTENLSVVETMHD